MRYWAIRHDNPSAQMTIKSKRRVSIAEGDRVIGVKGRREQTAFTWEGRVASIVREELPESEFYFVGLAFADVKPFDEPRYLEAMAASLLRVHNYESPFRHFARNYVSFYPMDFKTVASANVFIARTAVGRFLSDLPTPTLGRFVSILGARRPAFVTGQVRMAEIWDQLATFLVAEVVQPALLLHAVIEQATAFNQTLRQEGLDASAPGSVPVHLLAVQTEHGPGNLARQDVAMQRFLATIRWGERPNLLEEISIAIKEDAAVQSAFEDAFWGAPWPLPRTLF